MKKILFLLFVGIVANGIAQQKTISIDDAVMGFSKGLYPSSMTNLNWVEGSDNYVNQQGDELVFTNVRTNKVVRQISLSSLKNTFPELKRFPRIMKVSNSEFTFQSRNSIITYNYLTQKKSSQLTYNKNGVNSDYNAAGTAIAYTIDNNLYVATSASKKIPVTAIEDKNIVSGQSIHRSEFGIVKGTFWSPKGNILAFYQKDESNVTEYPIVDITTYPAELSPVKYPMAGQGSEKAKIGIFNLKTGTTTYLNIDTRDEHYLTNLSWSPDEKTVFLAEINRDQNHAWVNSYDIASGGKIRTLFEETNSAWTEPENGTVFLPNSNDKFLWLSERDGYMNLYQYNTSGTLIKQVTNFDWVVTGILGFDAKGKNVFITGTGADPRESHAFKVNLKSGKFEKLSSENGTHSVQMNAAGTYLIDSYSSLTIPRNIEITDVRKKSAQRIFTSPNPLKDYEVGTTEFIKIKGEDGTDLYGKIIKPYNFDPTKKYPVLVYVYGGPHAQLVTNSWGGGSSLWMPAFATLENYIVFTIDNRGSANRGFAFESVIHRKLGDAEIEDQLTGLAYLKSLNYVDSNRVAVNGWSYGGFMTTSMMLRNPGMFTTAVAGGPVTDWKYYEVMYGERYMDTPQENPDGYKKARVHNYIKNLDGKMLIIHGSIDPVVVPQHSMTLLQESVTNKIQIDFFTYPMHEHNVRGVDRVHLIKKMVDYIVTNNK